MAYFIDADPEENVANFFFYLKRAGVRNGHPAICPEPDRNSLDPA